LGWERRQVGVKLDRAEGRQPDLQHMKLGQDVRLLVKKQAQDPSGSELSWRRRAFLLKLVLAGLAASLGVLCRPPLAALSGVVCLHDQLNRTANIC
jgi:hypothetical protein